LRVLDLFSGIGGFSLGLEWAGMETVAFCEQDEYCKKVLRRHWPDVPIHNDIKELDGNEYRGSVELVCGGFPCQPFSVAGQRRGEEDDRALWKEMYRVIREVQPAWVFGENVTGIISMELDNVLLDLEDEGYATQAFVLPACALDARHRRDRVFILAHKKGRGALEYTPEFGLEEHGHSESRQPFEGGEDVGDTEHDGSFASEISRSSGETQERSPQGSIKTIESEGAGRPSDHGEMVVADPVSKSGGGGAVHTRPEDKGRKTRPAGGKSVQPKNGKSQPDHFESGGTSLADTNSDEGRRGSGPISQRWHSRVEYRSRSSGLTERQPNQTLADSNSEWQPQSKRFKQDKRGRSINSRKEESETVAHPNKSGVQGRSKQGVDGEVRAQPNDQHTERLSRSRVRLSNPRRKAEWKPEPDVGRVAHGIPNRVDRLKGLGNAVLPQIIQELGEVILDVEAEALVDSRKYTFNLKDE